MLSIAVALFARTKHLILVSSLGRRFARGAFWNLAGSIGARALGTISSIAMARMVGAEAYGGIGIIQTTVGALGLFAGLSMGLTATKYVAELRTHHADRAGRILALSELSAWASSTVVAVILFASSSWFCRQALGAPQLVTSFKIGTFLIVFGAVTSVQSGALVGLEAFRAQSISNLLTALSSLPVTITMTYVWGLNGAIWSLVISLAISFVVKLGYLRKEARRIGMRIRLQGASAESNALWHFSLPAVAGGILGSPINWLCTALLVGQPNGLAEMALFTAANQWRTAILFVPNNVGSVALPILANLQGDGAHRKHRTLALASAGTAALLAAIVAVPIILGAPFVMGAYGSAFAGGAKVLALLSTVAIVQSTNDVLWQALISKGRVVVLLLSNAVWGITVLSVYLWLIPHRSAVSLSCALLFGFMVQCSFSIYFLMQKRPVASVNYEVSLE
jgi:O-antigen/teichoic acid export membrane protein